MTITKIPHILWRTLREATFVWSQELRTVFRDEAVIVFMVVVPLGYPLLYSYIYNNEVVRDVPVAVIDESHTSLSRQFARLTDATENVRVVARCTNIEEARELMRRHKIYGMYVIPSDFSSNINRLKTAHVSVLCDASSLLYYKALSLAAIEVSLSMNAHIKLAQAGNTTARQDEITIAPLKYNEVNIFNPTTGIATFLLPAVLMLILQQTMLLGVGIAAGTMKEKNMFRLYHPLRVHNGGTCLIVMARALLYVAVYCVSSLYVLGIVPRIFGFIQIGHFTDIAAFMLPYLLAVTFFAMSLSYFVNSREASMLLFVFLSLVFIFIAGISWPGSAVPQFWKYVSYAIPSTFGVNGFVRMNNEGARLWQVAFEYRALWIQSAVYFAIACFVMRHDIISSCCNFSHKHRKTASLLH